MMPRMKPGIISKALTWAFGVESKAADWSSPPFTLINAPPRIFGSRTQATVRNVSIREGLAHELVFACLTAKTLAVQDSLPLIQRLSGSEWQSDLNHPALRALRNPNEQQTWADFLASLIIDEDTWGRWYVELIRSKTGAVVGLRPLDVRGMREIGEGGLVVQFDQMGFDSTIPYIKVVSYEITEAGQVRRLKKENVIAARLFDVRSPLAGYSRVQAALAKVGIDNSLSRYADAYLTNGGPSGLLTVAGKNLTPELAQQMKEQWRTRYAQGGSSEGEIAVLGEGSSFQPIGGHLDTMTNDMLTMGNEADICSTMGVPGQIVDAFYAIRFGNQRAGQETAQQKFWENTLSPTLCRYRQLFDKYLLLQFEPREVAGVTVRMFYDLVNVKALQEDIDKIARRSQGNFTSGLISINEARATQGLKPVQGGDDIPALQRQEAAKVALEQQRQGGGQQPGQPGKQPGKKPQPAAAGGKGGASLETKVYDWEGLQLSRAPTDLEAKSLKAVANAQDTAKREAQVIITNERVRLINEGIGALEGMSGSYEALTLTASMPFIFSLNAAVMNGFKAGQSSVSDSAKASKGRLKSTVQRIVTFAAAALVNQVQSRLVSNLARLFLRGVSKEEALKQTEIILKDESMRYVEDIAAGAAYEAVAEGRLAEMEATKQPGDRWVYSAILDANNCEQCFAEDGKEASDPSGLPDVPLATCAGTWRCRCFVIQIHGNG